MLSLIASDITIIGAVSDMDIGCGRATAVGERADGSYADIRIEDDWIDWQESRYKQAELDACQWAELSRKCPIPQSCIDQATGLVAQSPVVLFVNSDLLQMADVCVYSGAAAGHKWQPYAFSNDGRTWRGYATCCDTEASGRIMAEWAERLRMWFEYRFQWNAEHEELDKIADFELCAARSGDARRTAYIHWLLAAGREQTTLRRLERFAQREFADLTMQDVDRERARLSRGDGEATVGEVEMMGYTFPDTEN